MELAKTYDPTQVEERIYAFWEQNGYFKPENQIYLNPDEKPFVITIPPPNVTGTLHMGHALTAATEDLMTRYYRMKGARTLWVPGTDHAGIATQAVVEKKLAKEGKNRREMGRSAFLEEVWEFKEYSHRVITHQSKKLGISVDWAREVFTLDDNLSHAVRTAFKHLYEKGLIYRDTRMVNWDPVQLTGVSDLEAITEDEGEAGHLWYIKYPIQTNHWEGPAHEWGSGQWAEGATRFVTIATTRPETLLGDTAVMVNPDDERYTDLIGCRVILPALGRWTPIIGDEAVDKSFGTGAVKVTPAHDFTDYEVGKRHHLKFIEVMDATAKMNAEAGPYVGLDRFECRKRIVKDLEREGLLAKIEDYRVKLARGERSGAVIEPRISMQWFCNMQGMGKAAADAVREGKIKIVPERFEKEWFRWLDNIRDWTISRQLWWGHQIPVWYVEAGDKRLEIGDLANQSPISNLQSRLTQYCALNELEAYAAARADWGDDVVLVQETDVLDTWFSSGLWPFSTLGWPRATEDMRSYYPTTMLETGYDILFFWVARMVMLGIELTGQVPFDTVYLHGLIRQADGKKMSKSRPEKAVDPLDMIDVYGCDALRFYLITAGAPGNDIKMDVKVVDGKKTVERIEGARNFANKLWNAARFVFGKVEGLDRFEVFEGLKVGDESNFQTFKPSNLSNDWIRERTNQTIVDVRKLMDDYQYGEAGRLIYEFAWNDFCDWYVELAKLNFNRETAGVLIRTLDNILRLLHPFMPFLTEEIWQKLKEVAGSKFEVAGLAYPALCLAPYPQPITNNQLSVLQDMNAVQEVIRAIRNSRAEYKVPPEKKVQAMVSAGALTEVLQSQRAAIAALARVDEASLVIEVNVPAPDKCATQVLGDVTVYLPMAGLVDLDAERKRLQDELDQLTGQISRSENLLASDFGKRAPANVIEKEKAKMADVATKKEQIQQRLAQM
jgi:valyl-tRNA synthetase